MASKYKRLLEPTKLEANWKQPREDAFDGGAFRVIEVVFRRLKNGTTGGGSGGRAQLWHAPTNEEEAYLPLANCEMATDASGLSAVYVSVAAFTRFVRAQTDANVAGDPVFLIDVIGKE